MRLLFELSGEHPQLPFGELQASLGGMGGGSLTVDDRVATATGALDVDSLTDRLALTHFIDEEIVRGTFEEVVEAAGNLDTGHKTFSVRVKSYVTCDGKQAMERRVADRISGGVDLRSPDIEFVVVVTGSGHHLTRRVGAIDRSGFERRKVIHRPFFHPSSLHPRYARALVNLSGCPPGGTVLDPFCGTGGILLEAGLSGRRVLGGDRDPMMVEGARRTLDAYGVSADLRVSDAAELARDPGADVIVTDPPYGRSTSTAGESLPELYRRFFVAAASEGFRVAVILPSLEAVQLGAEHLALERHYTLPVHRSLTRHFCVFGPSDDVEADRELVIDGLDPDPLDGPHR